MWDHYAATPDVPDRDGRVFANKAQQVKAELWDFFRCQEGYEARENAVADKAAKKLIKDMHYEVRVQVIVTYHMGILRVKISKTETRTMKLTRKEYLKVNIEH
ncbi:uncharacterized protein LOC111257092 [Setaria italica]|uniref:uncharacterized protein LOC111257092 n=1 Tax=Setaria italica TaxID=4555 RepID=UPI000BE5D1DF|nr:uncharacterized protein LOC111257092 [Setaria italica]